MQTVGKGETSERECFVWMMPDERQGVQNLFNYPLDFMSENIQMTFFPMERGRKYLQERVSPHIISISKIIVYLSTFSYFLTCDKPKS